MTLTNSAMRVLLFGTGRMARMHAITLASDPRVEITIASDSIDRANSAAAALPNTRSSTAEQALSDMTQFDACVIASATSSHPHLIEICTQNRIPYFCEKPVAQSLEEADRLSRLTAQTGTKSQVGFHRRFDPEYLEVKQLISQGSVGELHRIHTVTADPQPPSPDFVKSSGGIIADCMIHDFDIIRFVTGLEFKEVYAKGAVRTAKYCELYGDVDEVVVTASMTDNSLATMQASRNNGGGYDVRMELAGTDLTVGVGYQDRFSIKSTLQHSPPHWEDFLDRFADCYRTELKAFLNMVANDGPEICSIQDVLATMKVVAAAQESLHTGMPVAVLPTQEKEREG